MQALRELEKNFQTHVLSGDHAVDSAITGNTAEQVATRLAVYSNGYRWRLLEVLELDYRLLAKLLGEKAFDQLGFEYIDAYPSHSFSIDIFAQYLPQFLTEKKPYCEQLHLSELADFIWALNVAIDAADASILTAQELAAVRQESWPEMRLTLHPSLQLLTYHWNVVDLWRALSDDKTLPEIVKLEKPQAVIVWRKAIQPFYALLDEKEVFVLQALQQEKTFEVVCEGLLQWLPEEEIAQYAVNLLLRWINDGMISRITI